MTKNHGERLHNILLELKDGIESSLVIEQDSWQDEKEDAIDKAIEAINQLLIEGKIEEIETFIGSSDMAGISNFNGNGLSAARRRIAELKSINKYKTEKRDNIYG